MEKLKKKVSRKGKRKPSGKIENYHGIRKLGPPKKGKNNKKATKKKKRKKKQEKIERNQDGSPREERRKRNAKYSKGFLHTNATRIYFRSSHSYQKLVRVVLENQCHETRSTAHERLIKA